MSAYDQKRRLLDLEVAIVSLARSLSEAGFAPIVEQAIRTTRSEGVEGAEDLVRGKRVAAAYRRL